MRTIAEPGEYWFDPGLIAAYVHTIDRDQADGIEVKLAFEKQKGKFLHRLNAGFAKQVSPHAEGGAVPVAAWSTRYRYDRHYEPGFEIQAISATEKIFGSTSRSTMSDRRSMGKSFRISNTKPLISSESVNRRLAVRHGFSSSTRNSLINSSAR